ncbi:hypothetical protein Tco_1444950 [Tanacetum coccineum]
MLNYMKKMERHSLLMVIDSNYIMKKKIIMTKGKQSLPSSPKNDSRASIKCGGVSPLFFRLYYSLKIWKIMKYAQG